MRLLLLTRAPQQTSSAQSCRLSRPRRTPHPCNPNPSPPLSLNTPSLNNNLRVNFVEAAKYCCIYSAQIDGAGSDSLGTLAVAGPGGRVRVFLSDLSEPTDLLDMEEMGGVRGVAALGFDVFSVASGGESEFLPEVYRPLFMPEEESA